METDTKYKRGIILVHFPKNEKHGCDKKCPQCYFSKINYNLEIKPTDEEIINYILKVESGSTIRLFSLGDTLYNFEENKDYLVHIIDLIKFYGYRVDLTTKYWDVLSEYFNTILDKVDFFSLSCDEPTQEILNTVKLISKTKKIRLLKIYNSTDKLLSEDEIVAQSFIEYFNVDGIEKENFSICFRFNDLDINYNPITLSQLKIKAANWTNELGYTVEIGSAFRRSRLKQLWGGREILIYETKKVAAQDMGLELESED